MMTTRTTLVAPERSGWRDEKISRRHREFYGTWAGAIDMDFLLIESVGSGIPKALIEYKHFYAQPMTRYQERVYRNLANMCEPPLPFFLAQYCNEEWWYRVSPQNDAARRFFMSDRDMTEHEYVQFLVDIRGIFAQIPDGLNHIKPPKTPAKKVS